MPDDLREQFENEMINAGWVVIKRDDNGKPLDWQHKRVRRQDDRSAFDLWKMTGFTPAPF